jgi:hypothetical protein
VKPFIELGAARVGAFIQNVCANVDFEVVSLPGGSLIAVLLWLYALRRRFGLRRSSAESPLVQPGRPCPCVRQDRLEASRVPWRPSSCWPHRQSPRS